MEFSPTICFFKHASVSCPGSECDHQLESSRNGTDDSERQQWFYNLRKEKTDCTVKLNVTLRFKMFISWQVGHFIINFVVFPAVAFD